MSVEKVYNVAVYIRLSKEDGDDKESESVENQRDLINNFIEENEDLEWTDEYVDDGYTGTNFDRPSFKKMIKDIENKKVDCVITKDLSRFGRDHIDTGYYLERYLPSNNIRYIAIGDGVDTETASGLNFMTFKLSFNDYYSQDISNKIRAVKYRKQEKGEYIAPYAPFGYKKDKDNRNHLVINEETAPIVKRIFKLYLAGMGTPKIADILNDENILAPSAYLDTARYNKCSHKWNKGAIYRLLKSQVYLGTVVGHKSYKVNHKVKTRVKVPKSEYYYVEDRHEPIIDKNTFEEVQAKLTGRSKCRDRKYTNPIKHFVYCGECGAKASLKTYKRQVKSGKIHTYQYFICGKKSKNYRECGNGRIAWSIVQPLVEKSIKEECSKIRFSNEDIISIYNRAKEVSNSKKRLLDKKIQRLENETQKIERKLEQIYIDKLDGIIKLEEFSAFYNSYQEKRKKNLIKTNELKQELEKINKEKMSEFSNIKQITDQCLKMEKLDKELLNKLIKKIEYFKDRKIKIKYKFININN